MEIEAIIEGVVRRIAASPVKAQKGEYLFRGLELSAARAADRVFVMFPQPLCNAGRADLYQFPLMAWEEAHVRLLNFETNNVLSNGAIILVATPGSQVILEPHRLITVTEAMEASRCAMAAELNLRINETDPYWMAKGKMVHSMFQSLINGHMNNWAPDFDRCFRGAAKEIISSLSGSAIQFNEKSIESEARIHYRNMRQWISSNLLEGRGVSTEEGLVSCLWGFRGRADLSIRNGHELRIIELKSGRRKADTHILQTLVYSTMAQATDESAKTFGSVLYSLTGDSVESGASIPSKLAKALLGRNRVVYLNRLFATCPEISLSEIHRESACENHGRCFYKQACMEFMEQGEHPFRISKDKRIQRYYEDWFRMLSTEIWRMMGDLADLFNGATLEDRLNSGSALLVARDLESDSFDAGYDTMIMLKAHTPVEIGAGESVIVHKGDPCAGDTLWGRVFKADDQSILVKVERNPLWPDQSGLHYPSDERLCLERLPFIRNRELARRSLSNFITNARELVLSSVILEADFPDPARDSQTRDLCKCENEPKEDLEDSGEISDMGFAEGLDQPLNSFQAAAIARALESDPYHLIHGPPGAGKTRVVSRLVRKCLDNGERVLLACPTNVALDRALDSLVDLGTKNFVRMGARSSCSPSLLAKLEKHRRNCNFIDDVAAKHNRIGKALDFLKSVPLVAATCHQVMSNSFFYNKRFDRVIIDEAGQLDEPTALAAIALGDRFVLSGDHQQLPPIVSSMAPSQDDVKGWGLDRSLFERLFLHGPADRISSLNIQYRMNAQIQSIVSNVFYNGLLRAAADVSARKLAMESHDRADPQLMNILDPACPVVFVDIQGPDSGKVSPEEALAVACITSELVRLGVGPQRIGVITPYRAQQALIRDYLLRLGSFDPGPTVNTVDRFQGGEREVIILSLSRSDNVTSFLADRKRLNVSLSRARSKLILLGRHTTIVSHSLFKDVLYGVPRVTFRPSESMRRCCEREERPIAGKEGELED